MFGRRIVNFFRNLIARLRGDSRAIFRYWDGEKWRLIDPVLANRAIWNDEACDLAADFKIIINPPLPDGKGFMHSSEEVIEAENRIADLTRRVFGLTAWSESQPGLTHYETHDLLDAFVEYIADLKKKRNTLRMPTPPSPATPPPSLDLPADGFPAGSNADYCSMPTASTDGEPTGSSSPSEASSAPL
jgi:hypothetical protein